MITYEKVGRELIAKDDRGKEIEGYFCPFAGRICYGGEVLPKDEHASIRTCRFWSSKSPPRCSFQSALGGLAAIREIPDMLQSLASQGRK